MTCWPTEIILVHDTDCNKREVESRSKEESDKQILVLLTVHHLSNPQLGLVVHV